MQIAILTVTSLSLTVNVVLLGAVGRVAQAFSQLGQMFGGGRK